jgi:1-aminocyclopropane-1-carboxylate deaminase/D-cysteine desulfhydrase-like pyridoxal-dependent ACC family enzyme
MIAAKAEALRAAGHNVYVPRQADTVDLDVIAYAQSALEVARQCREQKIEPGHMYVCAADTTQAGLVLGLKAVGSPMQVKGINPSFKGDNEERMAQIANQAAERLDLDVTLTAADFDNDDSFVGDRYGIPTPEGLAALRLLAQKEGILTDPVYSSKALAALVAHIRGGALPAQEPVVFVHTGGTPALFGYTDEMVASLA